jgi:hypothetical protein
LIPDGELPDRFEMTMDNFKAGDLALNRFKLLEFFSSKMSAKEEIEMMEILWMVASYYGFEADQRLPLTRFRIPVSLTWVVLLSMTQSLR